MKRFGEMAGSGTHSGRNHTFEALESRRLLSGSVQIGNALFFVDSDPTHGAELWKSDLDGSNKTLVKDIRPGTAAGPQPMDLFNFNGTLVFSALNGSPGLGRELWKSDGTEAGTELVKDIYSHSSGSNPRDFRIVNNRLVFIANAPPGIPTRVYTSDGTTAGTKLLVDAPLDWQDDLVLENGVAYFTFHGDDGAVRYSSDGTPEGTGPAAPAPEGLLRINGTSGDDQILIRRSSFDGTEIEGVVNDVVVSQANLADLSQLVIHGLEGADRIQIDADISLLTRVYGAGGNDTVFGGGGSDRVYGGDGNDWIGGFAGNDILYGEAGNDRMFGGAGRDHLDGGAGADVLRGEAGQDRIVAKSGEDDFKGNSGDVITFVFG